VFVLTRSEKFPTLSVAEKFEGFAALTDKDVREGWCARDDELVFVEANGTDEKAVEADDEVNEAGHVIMKI
jgi:hypothetical protein